MTITSALASISIRSLVAVSMDTCLDTSRLDIRSFQLQEDDVAVGYDLFRRNLETYHECMLSGNWGGIEEITRPDWAKRKDYA